MRSIEAGRALMSGVSPVADLTGLTPRWFRHHGRHRDHSHDCSRACTAPRYPAVAEAALAGDLSVDAAGLITAGLETFTDRLPREQLHELERRLVDKAVTLAVHEVRRMVAKAVAQC